MVMVWAGILAGGVTGRTPENPREAKIRIKGIDPESNRLTLQMMSGKTFLNSFYFSDNDSSPSPDNNATISWNKLELRVAGEKVMGDVIKATSDGVSIPVEYEKGDNTKWDTSGADDNLYLSENLSFHVGDVLQIENIEPSLSSTNKVTLIWTPKNRTLSMEDV